MKKIGLLILLVACSTKVETGLTGVEIVVETGARELDQLRFEGDVDGVEAFPATLYPDMPGTIDREESLVVLVADELAGSPFVARVWGFQGGTRAAAGVGSVTLVQGELAEVRITLTDAPMCGDAVVADALEACDDGNTDIGDGCSSECVVEDGWMCMHAGVGPSVCESGCGGGPTCAEGQRCLGGECVCDNVSCDGCCRGTMCLPGDSSTACGTGGLTCSECAAGDTCDGGVCSGCNATTCPDGCCSGSTCNPMGIDSCGIGGAACSPCDMLRADRCIDGACLCGDGDVCATGQRCVAGLCICDQTSCPAGCCDGTDCQIRTAETCGVAGSTCVACSSDIANGCAATGTCQCGAGPACGPGQRCLGGNCVCDSTSCTDGCCDGNVCRVSSLAACGPTGGACGTCDPLTADACTSGACTCGSGAACDAGQRCEGGVCICDGISCDGCCNGDTCETGDSSTACGAGGATCESCGGAACSGGVCASCNATTCPDGCCSGATCSTASAATCGLSGAACVACNPMVADQCVGGTCACGAGPACGPGQRCDGGTCVCDFTSCPDGCCDGTTCRARSTSTCGTAGGACSSCDPDLADNCDDTGSCACGTRPACSAGQRCEGGDCVCDGTSCPGGCCSGPTCNSPATVDNCGTDGFACTACDPSKADGCAAGGTCSCGSGSACGAGQACVGGACVCNSASCGGCCNGNVCEPGTDPSACGVGGSSCETCAMGCISGVCEGTCGAGCDGCCAGSMCISPATIMQCGSGGDSCQACDPITADSCVGGVCGCGVGAACDLGQHCVGGLCECDEVSCPSGCCQGNTCQPRAVETCGVMGDMCTNCTAGGGRADGCSPAGECTCGGGPACSPPLRCNGGACS